MPCLINPAKFFKHANSFKHFEFLGNPNIAQKFFNGFVRFWTALRFLKSYIKIFVAVILQNTRTQLILKCILPNKYAQ